MGEIEERNVVSSGHVPVLLQEIVFWLRPKSPGCYVDCTLGTGGTAYRILEASQPDGFLIGIDQDPEALTIARATLAPFLQRIRLVCRNFKHLKDIMAEANVEKVEGIVFDLGISSVQLGDPQRGFSFLEEGPLDMRMDPSGQVTASDLVNALAEKDLAFLIFSYGEERYSRRIAKAIVQARERLPLRTTTQLVHIIQTAVPTSYRHGRLHCATRTFQALRIAVNQELDSLRGTLQQAADRLVPGGRLCVLSFHSLEDRIVKHTFRDLSQKTHGILTVLTKKPCIVSAEEKTSNPRSRSAKLRVAERRDGGIEPQKRSHA